eukprot:TRINITY_DN7286_c0_g1_i8.p1 TRINITY_DN7286_c0_g1~~TRINITY_DN7286_c0_g1_i8.p1  ORF type:complete len:513 (+),score=26.55 TRINITY_DN7286_c0_g1_i8:35-1573(+)
MLNLERLFVCHHAFNTPRLCSGHTNKLLHHRQVHDFQHDLILTETEVRMENSMLKHQQTASTTKIWVTAVLCMLTNLCYGAMMAYIAVALPYYTDINNKSGIFMEHEASSWFVSLNQPVRMTGTLSAIILNKKLGRKYSLILSSLVIILGGILAYFATNFFVLMSGSLLAHFGSGLVVIPSYSLLNDISIIRLRGSLGSMNTLTMYAGYMYGLGIGMFISVLYLPLVMIAPALVFLAFFWLLPESPIWLASRDKTEKAKDVLTYLRGRKYNTDPEMKEIMGILKENDQLQKTKSVCSKEFLKPACVTTMLFFFQAGAGADTLSYFGIIIFQERIANESLLVFLFQAAISLGYLVSPYIMSRINRRPQFITSAMMMGLGMLVLGAENFIPCQSIRDYIPYICLLVTGLSYGLGVGPVPFVLMSEMFGVKYKSEGMAMAIAARCLMAFTQLKVFADVEDLIGISGIFLCHSLINMIAAIFVFCVLPETRNKSLSELEQIWRPKEPTTKDSNQKA